MSTAGPIDFALYFAALLAAPACIVLPWAWRRVRGKRRERKGFEVLMP
jgi:hypothetical protein